MCIKKSAFNATLNLAHILTLNAGQGGRTKRKSFAQRVPLPTCILWYAADNWVQCALCIVLLNIKFLLFCWFKYEYRNTELRACVGQTQCSKGAVKITQCYLESVTPFLSSRCHTREQAPRARKGKMWLNCMQPLTVIVSLSQTSLLQCSAYYKQIHENHCTEHRYWRNVSSGSSRRSFQGLAR